MAKAEKKSETYLRNNTLYDFLLELYQEDIVETIILSIQFSKHLLFFSKPNKCIVLIEHFW